MIYTYYDSITFVPTRPIYSVSPSQYQTPLDTVRKKKNNKPKHIHTRDPDVGPAKYKMWVYILLLQYLGLELMKRRSSR